MSHVRRGSRVVAVVRGLAEDDGVRLALGVSLLLAGPQIAEILASGLVRVGFVEARRGR